MVGLDAEPRPGAEVLVGRDAAGRVGIARESGKLVKKSGQGFYDWDDQRVQLVFGFCVPDNLRLHGAVRIGVRTAPRCPRGCRVHVEADRSRFRSCRPSGDR